MVKGIIIAAGMGRRLGALTADRPKCTLPIANLAIIERQLTALQSAGISDVSVVTGFAHHWLEGYPVKRFHNPMFQTNNVLASLMYARSELNDDVLVLYSDIVFDYRVIHQAAGLQGEFSVVVDSKWKDSYVGRTEHPFSEAEKAVVSKGRVLRIGKHVPADVASAEFTGVLRLSSSGCRTWVSLFGELEERDNGQGFQQAQSLQQAYLTDMLQELINRGHYVQAHEVDGAWMEIDTQQDYARATEFFRKAGDGDGHLNH